MSSRRVYVQTEISRTLVARILVSLYIDINPGLLKLPLDGTHIRGSLPIQCSEVRQLN